MKRCVPAAFNLLYKNRQGEGARNYPTVLPAFAEAAASSFI